LCVGVGGIGIGGVHHLESAITQATDINWMIIIGWMDLNQGSKR